jgi:hypothetical protein
MASIVDSKIKGVREHVFWGESAPRVLAMAARHRKLSFLNRSSSLAESLD